LAWPRADSTLPFRSGSWVVYAKPAFGGPMQVLRYLGRYTHRVAISNHRLLAFDQERVTFRWKDYAHGGKQAKMTLGATEFLRRFFLHVLPQRLRPHPALRLSGQSLSRFALNVGPTPAGLQFLDGAGSQNTRRALRESFSLHRPRCGTSMVVIQRFTAAKLSACMYFDSS